VERDVKQAVAWFRKAAEQGDAEGQYGLGMCYFVGAGLEQDDAQAFHWYSKAAEQGLARAQNNLGGMYIDGRGVARDPELAVQWLVKAAEQGDVKAQNTLGAIYKTGNGVAGDDQEAVCWFGEAAGQGSGRRALDIGVPAGCSLQPRGTSRCRLPRIAKGAVSDPPRRSIPKRPTAALTGSESSRLHGPGVRLSNPLSKVARDRCGTEYRCFRSKRTLCMVHAPLGVPGLPAHRFRMTGSDGDDTLPAGGQVRCRPYVRKWRGGRCQAWKQFLELIATATLIRLRTPCRQDVAAAKFR